MVNNNRNARSRLVRNVAGISAILVGLTLGGCAVEAPPEPKPQASEDGWDAVIAAAKQEGKLTLYTGSADVTNTLLADGFRKEYGIEIEVLRLAGVPLVQRFEAEADSGTVLADVMINNVYEFYDDRPELFLPLDEQVVPNIADFPEKAVSELTIDFSISPFGLQYNTDLFDESDIPDSWEDIIDPAWKDQVLFSDPRESANYAGWADAMEREYGTKFLQRFANLNFEIINSGAPAAQRVAAGSKGISLPSFPAFSAELIEQKAPIAFKALSGPQIGSVLKASISADAPHPNAARLFMHWVMNDEITAAVCEVGGSVSPKDPGGERLGCFSLPDYVPVTPLSDDRRQKLLNALGIAG